MVRSSLVTRRTSLVMGPANVRSYWPHTRSRPRNGQLTRCSIRHLCSFVCSQCSQSSRLSAPVFTYGQDALADDI